MDVIITDKDRKDIGQIESFANVDIDVNRKRTVTVQIARSLYDQEFTFDSWVYIPGTEYGGRIDRVKITSALDYVELTGDTCRGKLEKKAILPPDGETHKVMSGDIHEIMRELIDPIFDGMIVVSRFNTGKRLNDYRFDRYVTLLSGIEKMLKSESYKLVTRIVRGNGESVHFEVSAEPIIDFSNRIEFSKDNMFNYTMEEEHGGYNHIIALGKGEGLDRTVIHRYIGSDGSVSDTKYYAGYDENIYIYDNTSAESDDLQKKADQKLLEIASKKKLGISAVKLSNVVKISDIVGGRDETTGMSSAKPIENIICKIRNGVADLSYTLEGE